MLCEFIGGPRDGEQFTVPGPTPPDRIKVLDVPGDLTMWHVAAGDVPVAVCTLDDDNPLKGPCRYRWPRASR